ncbi:MAG: hypothetical protein JWR10_3437 [Rubritepida sp.]|nr:hypothetical protein [Rubritepida sp.]
MKLTTLAAPLAAAADGLWLPCGPGWGDIELRVRPYTEGYQTLLSRAQAEAVRAARADGRLKPRESFEDLPLDARLALARDLLLKHLVADIRKSEDDDGKATTVETFRAHAMDLDNWGPGLADKAFELVSEVTTDRDALRKAAGGNSGRSSGSGLVPAKPTQ